MKKQQLIRIPMPLRYGINLALIVALWALLAGLTSAGIITNYWSGIIITIGINIILAVSLNVATGYLGQLPLGHAGFMAVGAYTGGIFIKSTPAAELINSGETAAALPYTMPETIASTVFFPHTVPPGASMLTAGSWAACSRRAYIEISTPGIMA